MIDKILVAVDGSEHSQKALEFASQLAAKFQGRLHIVHVPQGPVSDRVMFLGGASVTLHATPSELEDAGRSLLEASRRIAEQAGVAHVETRVLGGDPADAIIADARDISADVIVLGSRGLGDLGGLLLGSVSHQVNHRAPCTCITVRA
ncbi:MAG: universal stress protein [Pseudomonadales bacterium]